MGATRTVLAQGSSEDIFTETYDDDGGCAQPGGMPLGLFPLRQRTITFRFELVD